MSKIQFLLHIHKKDLFIVPTPTEVAFNTLTLQDFILQQSISAQSFWSSEDY